MACWPRWASGVADQADVRRIAMALPGAVEHEDRFAFSILNRGKLKAFAWVWMERIHPKKGRIPNPAMLAVRVADLAEKELLLAADPGKFFTEPHYNGFPAVIIRLAEIDLDELAALIREGWRCQAPRELVRAHSPLY